MGSASAYDADASSSSAGTGTDSTMTKQPKAPKHDLTSLNAELAARGWTKRPLRLSGMSERETSEVVGVIYEIVSSAQVRQRPKTQHHLARNPVTQQAAATND